VELSYPWMRNVPYDVCEDCNAYYCGTASVRSNLVSDLAADGMLNKRCLCSRNFYKNASITVPTESSIDCIQCPEGSASTIFDGTSCTICDIGYYSPTGLLPCSKCADGKTTNGYQQTSCTVTSTFTPTPNPTPSPTHSSPSTTNPPTARPTRAPVRSKKPSAHPTMIPTQPNQCSQGNTCIHTYIHIYMHY
jgi:hypothetical protein